MKAGTAINDMNRKVAIVMKEMLRIWEEYFKTILRQRETYNLIYLASAVGREIRVRRSGMMR